MTVPKTMRKTILFIKDTANPDYVQLHFAPTRNAEGVVSLHDSLPVLRGVKDAIDLKVGDIVEL
jgi:hypothetical protein